MLKNWMPLLLLPLALGLAGCATNLTNLSPTVQQRRSDNLYPVSVALASHQQTLRWQSIRPQIMVGTEFYPMRPTPMMTNRWEGYVPADPQARQVRYRYKFDWDFNAFGKPKQDSLLSPEYVITIRE
jgi:hypothetical protein